MVGFYLKLKKDKILTHCGVTNLCNGRGFFVANKQFLKRTHYVVLMLCWNTCIRLERTAK